MGRRRGTEGFTSRAIPVVLLLVASACGRPILARDGTLIFPEQGAHGATILTANGLEFRDVTDVPLATLARLDAAFVGDGARADLRPVARMHAQSLALLARDMNDRAAAEQAAMLEALLDAGP
jgi:hypothetical protein